MKWKSGLYLTHHSFYLGFASNLVYTNIKHFPAFFHERWCVDAILRF